MAIDILQEKIRKLKNPSMLELAMPIADMPSQFSRDAAGYGEFCRELLTGLKGLIPAVRVSFAVFSLLGDEGISQLQMTLQAASELGYYVALDAPEIVSPMMAKCMAEAIMGEESRFFCDGLIISPAAKSLGINAHAALFKLDVAPKDVQYFPHVLHIADIRAFRQRYRRLCKYTGCHQRQHGILCTMYPNLSC